MRWRKFLRKALISLGFVIAGLVVALALFLRLPWIRTETVRYQSGDVTLVATLALPRWRDPPYPAAVVVHGAGGIPRLSLWAYARNLAPYGMAVLMYDKRGVGDSTGTNPQDLVVTVSASDVGNPDARPMQPDIAACGKMIELLAQDAQAGVDWLETRTDIDKTRIGFVGISQAGWIMPLAASSRRDIAFIVNISGPAVSCGIENRYSELTGENPGFRDMNLSSAEMDQALAEYDGPVGYDPLPVLSELRVPSLWLLGGRDRSVPTSWSVANLKRIVADHRAPFEIQVYPEGDHSLTTGDTSKLNMTMFVSFFFKSIDYWSDIRDWLETNGVIETQR